MSIYTRGEPVANHQFRANTDKSAGSMPNICRIPKREKCVDCGKHRTKASGVMKKRGWVCG